MQFWEAKMRNGEKMRKECETDQGRTGQTWIGKKVAKPTVGKMKKMLTVTGFRFCTCIFLPFLVSIFCIMFLHCCCPFVSALKVHLFKISVFNDKRTRRHHNCVKLKFNRIWNLFKPQWKSGISSLQKDGLSIPRFSQIFRLQQSHLGPGAVDFRLVLAALSGFLLATVRQEGLHVFVVLGLGRQVLLLVTETQGFAKLWLQYMYLSIYLSISVWISI